MRRALPGLVAVAVLAALVAFFYRGILVNGFILGDYDAFVYFYPLRQYAADALREGRLPLWNPDLFLGAPFLANVQTAVLYPPNLIYALLPVPRAFAFSVASHILLAGVSMYFFSRRSLGISLLPALLASAALMFSGFLSGQAGHVNQVNVSAWLPLLLLTFDEAVSRRSLALGIAVGLIGTLQLLAGHTQEWYFSTVTLGLFALWRVVAPRPSGSPGGDLDGRASVAGGAGPDQTDVGSERDQGSDSPGVRRPRPVDPGVLAVDPALPNPRSLDAGASAPGSQAFRVGLQSRYTDSQTWAQMPPVGQVREFRQMAVPVGKRSGAAVAIRQAGLVALARRMALRLLLVTGFLVLAGAIEAGVGAVQVLPSMELSGESIRGGGMSYWDAVSFSLPPTTALYTLLPTYPATLFSEYVGYVGVVCLVLAALAVLRWSVRPATLFLVGLAFFGLFMALGGYNPLYPRLFKWVPGLDLFRVPARWLFVYTFAVTGLAGLGAQAIHDRILRSPSSRLPSRPGLRGRSLLTVGVGAALIGLVIVMLGLLATIADPRPTSNDYLTWGLVAAAGLVLCALPYLVPKAGWVSLAVLPLLAVGELWMAGGSATFRHSIPMEAYRPDRTSTTALLQDAAGRGVPERLVSFATNEYEVKETPDYKKEYSWMDSDQLHMFLTDIKLSETLAPNIPMEYGIETADGYDGGILPLKRYGELKSQLLPGTPPDNQLRNHLDYVPPEHWLDLMNVRYVLGTKLQDVQVDNVYYDRGISVDLDPGQSLTLSRMPDIMTTSVGIISSTEGARSALDGDLAAQGTVTDVSGATYELPMRMGIETAETPQQDADQPPAAHQKPRAIPAWTPEVNDTNYYAKITLPARIRVKDITLKNVYPAGAKVRFRAVTLIDDVAAVSSALVLSDRLDRELFFDMKLYRVRDPLPRAFLADNSSVLPDENALNALKAGQVDLRSTVLLAPSPTARNLQATPAAAGQSSAASPPPPPSLAAGSAQSTQGGAGDAGQAKVSSYKPEEVSVNVSARGDGFLVLLDAFYPGWVAYVDGRQTPIERADYFFRAVRVPAGEHSVVFRYQPASFQTGLRISLATGLLLIGTLLVLGIRRAQHPLPRML